MQRAIKLSNLRSPGLSLSATNSTRVLREMKASPSFHLNCPVAPARCPVTSCAPVYLVIGYHIGVNSALYVRRFSRKVKRTVCKNVNAAKIQNGRRAAFPSSTCLGSHAGHQPDRGHRIGTVKQRKFFRRPRLAFSSFIVLDAPRAAEKCLNCRGWCLFAIFSGSFVRCPSSLFLGY